MADVILMTSMPYYAGIDLGLAYLASALRRDGHDVLLHEAVSTMETPADLAAWTASKKPRVVGFKVWTPNIGAVRRYLQALRGALPLAVLVGGGPHVTGVGAEIFDDLPELDYAIAGEAETGLAMLVKEVVRGRKPRAAVLSSIPGLIRRKDGAVRANPLHFAADLDDLADPAWDLCDFDRYNEITGGSYKVLRFNWIHVQATRGCPNHCTYCLATKLAGHTLRHHSAPRVVGQIETIAKRHGVRSFSFADDNLTLKRDLALGIFGGLMDLGLGVTWNCHSNGLQFDTLDGEMARLMEGSGCTGLTLGIESGSPRLLKKMNRTWYTLDEVGRTIRTLRANSRIELCAFFLIGYPDETDADMMETIRLIRRIDLDKLAVNVFTPWPGTPISRKLRREGRLPPWSDAKFWYEQVTMPTDHIPAWRLNLYQVGCYSAFFSRPSRLYRHVSRWGVKNFVNEVRLIMANKLFGRQPDRRHFGRIGASQRRRDGGGDG